MMRPSASPLLFASLLVLSGCLQDDSSEACYGVSCEAPSAVVAADVGGTSSGIRCDSSAAGFDIRLTWDAPEDLSCIDGYKMYRATSSLLAGAAPEETHTVAKETTTYLFEGIATAVNHFFAVTTYNAAAESVYSNELTAYHPSFSAGRCITISGAEYFPVYLTVLSGAPDNHSFKKATRLRGPWSTASLSEHTTVTNADGSRTITLITPTSGASMMFIKAYLDVATATAENVSGCVPPSGRNSFGQSAALDYIPV